MIMERATRARKGHVREPRTLRIRGSHGTLSLSRRSPVIVTRACGLRKAGGDMTDHLAEYRRRLAAGEVDAPERAANPLERANAAPVLQCPGAGQDPGWREAIRDCSARTCALHPHRPGQR
jgi:hypothetical protein